MKNGLLGWIGKLLVKLGLVKIGGKLMSAGSFWFFYELEVPQQLRDVE